MSILKIILVPLSLIPVSYTHLDVYKRQLKGCYSEKTGKTYDASVLLEDDGQRTGYKLVFDNLSLIHI